MHAIDTVIGFLEQFAPPALAEDWDNVGLLVGDRRRNAERVMTCLTVTPATADEAVEQGVDLIVTHHPLPFEPVKRLTPETTVGWLLMELIEAQIAVYSPHTAFDSAQEGINQRLATGLGLRGIWPLVPREEGPGVGRWGWLAELFTLQRLADRVKEFLSIDRLQIVGEPEQPVRTVAVACGAAGELLPAAREVGCDAMLLGEARFHTCLEAEAAGIGLVLPGHFASERFAVESLADALSGKFPELEAWASRREGDPLKWV